MNDDNKILITGASCILPIGRNLTSCSQFLMETNGCSVNSKWLSKDFGDSPIGLIPDEFFGNNCTDLEKRFHDRITLIVSETVGQCLDSAQVHNAEQLGNTGIISGSGFGCLYSGDRFMRTLHEKGPGYIDPLEFPRTSHNYPASSASIKFGLKGPITAIVNSTSSGFDAIIYAAHQILSGRVPRMVVVAFDEMDNLLYAFLKEKEYLESSLLNESEDEVLPVYVAEGCAAIMLESEASATQRGAQSMGQLSGWHTSSGQQTELNGVKVKDSILAATPQRLSGDDCYCLLSNGSGYTPDTAIEKWTMGLLGKEPKLFDYGVSLKPTIGNYLGAAGLVETILMLSMPSNIFSSTFSKSLKKYAANNGHFIAGQRVFVTNSMGLDGNLSSVAFIAN